MTRALVTGATGFVGANLIELLNQQGWHTRALRREKSSLKALAGLEYESALGDVTELDALRNAMRDIEVVFHVAAVATYWNTTTEHMYRVNVDGTRNVLQAAREMGARRVVCTSSVAALGLPPFGQQFDESATFNMRPSDFYYGHSKAEAEKVIQQYVADGSDVVTVNPAVIMGPRDINLIGGKAVIQAAKTGIPIYTTGGVCVIDVADVCAGHVAAAERGRRGERYILGGENLTYKELLTTVTQVVGKPKPVLQIGRAPMQAISRVVDAAQRVIKFELPLSGDQMRYSTETFWFNSSKARRELGLTTRPFVESVRRTYDWYRANGYLM